jgi:ADP-dependent phosphofructokinase/glucokinase
MQLSRHSIVDVSDAEKPRVVSRITNQPGVQSQYIDVLETFLLSIKSGCATPRPIRAAASAL